MSTLWPCKSSSFPSLHTSSGYSKNRSVSGCGQVIITTVAFAYIEGVDWGGGGGGGANII